MTISPAELRKLTQLEETALLQSIEYIDKHLRKNYEQLEEYGFISIEPTKGLSYHVDVRMQLIIPSIVEEYKSVGWRVTYEYSAGTLTSDYRESYYTDRTLVFKFYDDYTSLETKCEECGSSDAIYSADPYEEDVNNRQVMRWLCPHCYTDIVDEI